MRTFIIALRGFAQEWMSTPHMRLGSATLLLPTVYRLINQTSLEAF